jgi:seryl-tRNA synthetase
MIDLKSARADAKRVRSPLARRGADKDFDRLLALDQQRRDLLSLVTDLRGRRRPKSGGRPRASEIADARGAKTLKTMAGVALRVSPGRHRAYRACAAH